MDALRSEGFEMHLNAGLNGIPEYFVAEVLRIEVCAEIVVQTSEHVQVERSGNSGSIVVGGQ